MGCCIVLYNFLMNSKSKIVRLNNISSRIKNVKKSGQTVGFVEGVFDVIHLGHIELMEFAKKHCDYLVVGVASDAYVRSTKGKSRPIFTRSVRCKVISALSIVDLVLAEDNPPALLESKDSEEYLQKVTKIVNPDIIIASGTTDRNLDAKKTRAKEVGAKFIVQKDPRPTKDSSTTRILSLLGHK